MNVLELGLLWNNIGDRTPYRRICTVEPGRPRVRVRQGTEGALVLRTGSLCRRNGQDIRDAKAMLREKLTSAVRLRLRSDVPVAIT